MKSSDYCKSAKTKALIHACALFCTTLFCSSAMAVLGGQWVAQQGNGVVVASGGRNTLTICRVAFNHPGQPIHETNQPGNLWAGVCHYGLDRAARQSNTYELLIDQGYSWINPGHFVTNAFGSFFVVEMPPNAIDGGEAGNGTRFGICEAYTPEDSTWRPGKFYAGVCYISWGGEERGVEPDFTNQRVRVLVR